jgi:hypothetical protein
MMIAFAKEKIPFHIVILNAVKNPSCLSLKNKEMGWILHFAYARSE